mgnify:FL=1
MSADQELAATGGSSVLGALGAGVLLVGAGIALLWRKIAMRSAANASD